MRLSCPAIPEDDSGLTALMSNDLPYIHKTPNKLKKKKKKVLKEHQVKGLCFVATTLNIYLDLSIFVL